MRIFTRAELHRHDGKEGAPAYIAFEGKVYDVTRSFLWRKGKHQAEHYAGNDLSDALGPGAPHGPDLLERAPLIGMLAAEELTGPLDK